MKKRIFVPLLALISVLCCFFAIACAETVKFELDGGGQVCDIVAELDELVVLPKVVAYKGGEKLEVTTEITNSKGETAELVNGKLRATDMGGYTIKYSAGGSDCTVKVTVKDTKAPSFRVMGTSGSVVILNNEVTVPECKAIDASSDLLEVKYVVFAPDGSEVTVTNEKFVAAKEGTYTVRYSAEDASGNKGTYDFYFVCKNAVILNDFEKESDIYLVQDESVISVTDEAVNGKGLRIDFDQSVDPDGRYRYIRIPLVKADGSFYEWDELLEFEGVQLYVYLSSANELGLTNFTRAVGMGANVLYYSKEELIAAKEFSASQYSANLNGFFINVKYSVPGTYMIFDYFIGVYPENYVYPVKFYGADGEKAKTELAAKYNDRIAVPEVTAIRNGNDVNVTAKVFDSKNVEVTLTENAFTATDTDGYVIVYTATDEFGSAEFKTTVTVEDTRIPVISVDSAELISVPLGSEYTLPDSSVEIITGETIIPKIGVKSPAGDDVTVENGKFIASVKGVYEITYTAESADGKKSEKVIKIDVKNGVILNRFGSVGNNPGNNSNDLYWTNPQGATAFSADKTLHGAKVLNVTDSGYNIYIPLRNENSAFCKYSEIAEFESLEIRVYSSAERKFCLPTAQIFNVDLTVGWNTVSVPKANISAMYEEMGGGFYAESIQGCNFYVSPADKDSYLVFAQIFGVYADDYVAPVTFEYNGGKLPAQTEADYGANYVVPAVTAKRKNSEVAVTYKVFNAANEEVAVENGAFAVSQIEDYVIVYTAQDEAGSAEARIIVKINDTRTPMLTPCAFNGKTIILNGEVSVPECLVAVATGEELTATVTVLDPDLNEVTLENGKFTPDKAGNYTVKYTAVSAVNGKTGSAELTLVCIDGVILNSFKNLPAGEIGGNGDDFYWIRSDVTVSADDKLFAAKVENNVTAGYNIYIPLRNASNNFCTIEELENFSALKMTIYSSCDRAFSLCDYQAFNVQLIKGWNTFNIPMSNISALYQTMGTGFYANSIQGMQFYVGNAEAGEYLAFGEIAGINKPLDGEVLNSFTNVPSSNPGTDGNDIFWVRNEVSFEKDESFGGIKITNLADGGYDAYIPLKKTDGSYYSFDELSAFKTIRVTLYSSCARNFGPADYSVFYVGLVKGKNVVDIPVEKITAIYEKQSTGFYAQSIQGMKFYVDSAATGEYLTIKEIFGVK